jgi:tetratricopeptide (TPR) repeat protein
MDMEARAKVIETLTKLSLARCTFDSTLTIHDLTREHVVTRIRERGDNDPIKVAVRLVSNALRSIEAPESPTSWPLCADLVTHLRHQISNNGKECDGSSQQYQAAIIGAEYLSASGHYQASQDLLAWVLSCHAVAKLSVGDPEQMQIMDMLGASFRDAGKYDVYHCQLAFARYEKALGPDHPDTLTFTNNLALLYSAQGKYDEAAVLYQRSFAGYKKALGPDHPSTLTSANNLAGLYEDQGKYDEAAVLYQRSFAGREKALGPDHPSTLTSANNLAALYHKQGKYDEAAVLYQRSFAGREKALGPDHPSTLTSANNLALLYHTQGKYDEAAALYQRSFAGHEKALGPDHPDTLTSANNLAVLYHDQGKYTEAAVLYQRSFAGRENALGPDHPDTLASAADLAHGE